MHLDVSTNSGTPKSSISIGFSIINHPCWGTPIFGNPHVVFSFKTNSTAELSDSARSHVIAQLFPEAAIQVVGFQLIEKNVTIWMLDLFYQGKT